MNYAYSPAQGAFYAKALQENYEAAGTWPADLIDVSDADYQRLVADRPSGQRLQLVADELPILMEPVLTDEQMRSSLVAQVQSHLDVAATAHGYDDIRSAVTYADEPAVERFQREGKAFRAWRSLVWECCYDVLADVESGARAIPTIEQLFAELPALTIPAAPAVEGE